MGQYLYLIFIVALVAWMFWSQRRQAKNREASINAIKKGDAIVTIGGLHGIVDDINDQTVVLDCDGIYLTFDRSAIRNRVAEAAKVEPTTETAVEAEEVVETAIESEA